jgi:uncharacterized membrane protein
MDSYIIIAIIGTVLFGINSIIIKGARNIDSISLTLVMLSTAAVLTLLYWAFLHPKKEITTDAAIYGVFSGVIYALAFILFIVALRLGNVSVVSTINSLSAVVAVVLAFSVLQEKLEPIKIVGIVLGIIAAVLLSW